ncbi:MAG: hypothetical protein M1829_002164 [Trizodia sp. TS-e1964]|nr:MAG: hypothetical protein M1829_002164 [Trizodia sp. TS-e1964]
MSESSPQEASPTRPELSVPTSPKFLEGPTSAGLAAKPIVLAPNVSPQSANDIPKATLRIDAFLGEWLSPDYFDLITPPPGSLMMVAGAKADLLRRAEDIEHLHEKSPGTNKLRQGRFPGGWCSATADIEEEDGPFSSLPALRQALPERDRSGSHSSSSSIDSPNSLKGVAKLGPGLLPASQARYQPPIPTYAISQSDPIPTGYVAHARDACISVDFQWDSMREPLGWGNGGEYGEEWSSMHQRFRKGLHHLIAWYRADGGIPPIAGSRDTIHSLVRENNQDEGNESVETVVILVTHGAGCNALIGALTNQPVLLDVGMASLTMAFRKALINLPFNPPSPGRPQNHQRISGDGGLSDVYEVKLIASTEHLRAGSNPLCVPQLQGARMSPSLSGRRHRFGSSLGSSLDGGYALEEQAPRHPNSTVRRSTSLAAPGRRVLHPSSGSSPLAGLWSSPSPKDKMSEEAEDDDNSVLDFYDSPNGTSALQGKDNPNPKSSAIPLTDQLLRQQGLWVGSPADDSEVLGRNRGQKRRWTVNDHTT